MAWFGLYWNRVFGDTIKEYFQFHASFLFTTLFGTGRVLNKKHMKKTILFALFLTTFQAINAQISTTKINDPKPEPIPVAYDSTLNYLSPDKCILYVGQTFYVKGKDVYSRKIGYKDFYKDYKQSLGTAQYDYTKYDKLAGKYLFVQDHIEYYGKHFLKLVDTLKSDTIYYEQKLMSRDDFPFIVMGYFDKLGAKYKGKQFVVTNNCLKEVKDVQSGGIITFNPKDIWTFNEFTVNENNFKLSFKLSNNRGNTILIDEDKLRWSKWGNGYELTDANEYKKKFGEAKWNKILEGKLEIGFTEEMVKVSWGYAKKVNKSSSGDQWVYDGQYLYFENGILKAFN